MRFCIHTVLLFILLAAIATTTMVESLSLRRLFATKFYRVGSSSTSRKNYLDHDQEHGDAESRSSLPSFRPETTTTTGWHTNGATTPHSKKFAPRSAFTRIHQRASKLAPKVTQVRKKARAFIVQWIQNKRRHPNDRDENNKDGETRPSTEDRSHVSKVNGSQQLASGQSAGQPEWVADLDREPEKIAAAQNPVREVLARVQEAQAAVAESSRLKEKLTARAAILEALETEDFASSGAYHATPNQTDIEMVPVKSPVAIVEVEDVVQELVAVDPSEQLLILENIAADNNQDILLQDETKAYVNALENLIVANHDTKDMNEEFIENFEGSTESFEPNDDDNEAIQIVNFDDHVARSVASINEVRKDDESDELAYQQNSTLNTSNTRDELDHVIDAQEDSKQVVDSESSEDNEAIEINGIANNIADTNVSLQEVKEEDVNDNEPETPQTVTFDKQDNTDYENKPDDTNHDSEHAFVDRPKDDHPELLNVQHDTKESESSTDHAHPKTLNEVNRAARAAPKIFSDMFSGFGRNGSQRSQQQVETTTTLSAKVGEEAHNHKTIDTQQQQPKKLDKDAELAAKYAAIESVEERAYQILLDLGMLSHTD